MNNMNMKSVFECENEKLCMLIYYDAFNGPSDAKIILNQNTHLTFIHAQVKPTTVKLAAQIFERYLHHWLQVYR